MRSALAALSMTPFLAAMAAGEIRFALPVDCDLGKTCYIQQYMDQDPGPGFQDFRCNALSYDGHKGTDYALPNPLVAQQGVSVLAALDGVVLGVRDGMPDVWSGQIDEAAISGKDCGNGLVIDHGDGWHTQYCHLKQGSVTVKKGDPVSTGTVLGDIGMSGRTQFPHLHLSVRKDGNPIDPFAPNGAQCNQPTTETLWIDATDYQPGGLIDLGFAIAVPDYAKVKAGLADETLARTSPAIVAFSFAFGGRTGDILRQNITGPGYFNVSNDHVLDRNRAQFFRAIGKKRRSAPWPGGQYIATTELIRGNEIIDRATTTVEIPK
jgi:hypothetical protein